MAKILASFKITPVLVSTPNKLFDISSAEPIYYRIFSSQPTLGTFELKEIAFASMLWINIYKTTKENESELRRNHDIESIRFMCNLPKFHYLYMYKYVCNNFHANEYPQLIDMVINNNTNNFEKRWFDIFQEIIHEIISEAMEIEGVEATAFNFRNWQRRGSTIVAIDRKLNAKNPQTFTI